MSEHTNISWTDSTFNPWIGCTKVSAGCKNCYAATRDARHMLGPVDHWGPGAPRHVTSDSYWRQPISWAKKAHAAGKRIKVFSASQADIFDAEAPKETRRRFWELIGETFHAIDWQLVTKRPERIAEVMDEDGLNWGFFELCRCWLITSTENQEQANIRIPSLLHIPAAIHGISAEPLLGAIDLSTALYVGPEGGWEWQFAKRQMLNWVICGGESGPSARPMHPDWARGLRDQCQAAGVPFFFKQWGQWGPCEKGEMTPHPQDCGATSHIFIDDSKVRCAWEEVYYVGKKVAGARLDGVEWKQFPEVKP